MEELTAKLKIVIIGETNVGKSSLLLRFLDNSFIPEGHVPTIGVDFRNKEMTVDGVKVKLAIWDTAGQERFQTITPTYYRDAHGAILVYDVTDPTSLKKLEVWLEELQYHSMKENIVKMIVGNKVDLERRVSKEQGLSFAKKHNALFIEASALTSVGIEYAFTELVRKIIQTPDMWESSAGETIKLSNTEEVSSSRCWGMKCW